MSKKKRWILIVVVSAMLWPIIFYLALRETNEARITRSGVDAVATIVALHDEHETRHDHRPLMRVTVERVRDGAPFRASADRRMEEDELAAFQVGVQVAIRYDPESPEDFVLLRLADTTDAGAAPPPSG